MGLLDLECHRNLLGNGPHKAHQFSGNRDDHLVGMFAPGHEAANAFAQPHLRLPADVLDGFGLLLEPQVYMPTDVGGIARGPSPFDHGPTRMGMAGFGEGPLPAALAPGVFRGDQPQAFHPLSRVLNAREVTEFRHGGDGHGALDATQGLEGFDDRIYTPGLDLFVEFLRETPQACRVFRDSRTYSWKTIGWAGVRQTPSESQRRWAGPQVAWPV
jgi:hypothetical protein